MKEWKLNAERGRTERQPKAKITDKYSFLFSTYNSNSLITPTNTLNNSNTLTTRIRLHVQLECDYNSNALNKHSHTVTPIAQSH